MSITTTQFDPSGNSLTPYVTSNLISSSVSSSFSQTASFSSNGGGGGTSLTTGSFYPITSSWSVSSSYSYTQSYSLFLTSSISSSWSSQSYSSSYYKVFPNIKSGQITSQSFGGTPLTYSVTFTSSYSNTKYSVGITGGDARSWTIEQVSASNFTISTNSSVLLSQNVYWISMATGESP